MSGRDYCDFTVKNEYERLSKNFKEMNQIITYKDKDICFDISLSQCLLPHPYFGTSNYLSIVIEDIVSSETLRMVLSAAKNAFPTSDVFVENQGDIIGVGPDSKKYSSLFSLEKPIFSSIEEMDESLVCDSYQSIFQTSHSYKLHYPRKDGIITYGKKRPFYKKVFLNASVDDDSDHLFTPISRWSIKIIGETGITPTITNKLSFIKQYLQPILDETLRTSQNEVQMSSKGWDYFNNSLKQFISEERYFEPTTFFEHFIPPNSLFSLHCIYVMFYCKTFKEHQNSYYNFIKIIKEIISKTMCVNMDSTLPNITFPYIYNLCCIINFFIYIDEINIKNLPEIGFTYNEPTGEDQKIQYLQKDVLLFKSKYPEKSVNDFYCWYNEQCNDYNKTHPIPFRQREEFSEVILQKYFKSTKARKINNQFQKYYFDIKEEIQDILNLLINVTPQQYFLDYIITIITITPTLLIHKNSIFKPSESMLCLSQKLSCYNKSLFDLLNESNINSESLIMLYHNTNDNELDALGKVLHLFYDFEQVIHQCYDITERLFQNNIVYYQQQLSFNEGIQIYASLTQYEEIKPHEYEWVIKKSEKEEYRYFCKNQEHRISLSWHS
ncbi:Uncharacterized protein QTN25_001545 [Entamoeba marina]